MIDNSPARCCRRSRTGAPMTNGVWRTTAPSSARAASRSSTSTRGSQPVANEDGTVWVDSERRDLQLRRAARRARARGHAFRTQGDTEIIVHLYEEHGDGFVDHLRGMFAIALWDRPRRRLVLARDRLGKKPLYWRLAGGRLQLRLGAEGLLADPCRRRRVDRDALALFLEYQYIPSPRTIIDGVHKLPPATC